MVQDKADLLWIKLLQRDEYQYTYEEEIESNGGTVITLEVISNYTQTDPTQDYPEQEDLMFTEVQQTTESQEATCLQYINDNSGSQTETSKPENNEIKDQETGNTSKLRTDLLEYITRNDGSVLCKLCGDILQSRTHWYRHKYKAHAIPPLNPAPLFQCEQCLVFFKSRKGYIGHLASRHSEVLSDSSPVLTNSQAEALAKQVQTQTEVRDDTDPELAIPKTSVPNYQSIVKQATRTLETKRQCRNNKDQENQADWEERRTREEKLVADIIDRVRRECEAQGSGGPARRGYTRRTTVMHT